MAKLFDKHPTYIQKLYSNRNDSSSSLGVKGTRKGEFMFIGGISKDEYLNLYIVDSGNSRIQVFSINRQFITTFGEGILKLPFAIAVHNCCVAVSDLAMRKIVRFEDNKIILSFRGSVKKPMGLAIDDNSEVYVADSHQNVVVIFDNELKHTRTIGKDKLIAPRDVKIHLQQVFVADNNDELNIHIFTKSGDLLKSLISLKQGCRSLFICLDQMNNIAVSDTKNREILISTPKGKIFQHWFISGRPTGILITEEGVIVRGNHDHSKVFFH